jgi:predicted phosphodiesterase
MPVTYAILNDIHIPYHDKKVLNLVLSFLKKKEVKIDEIILNGDIVDCYPISTFDKKPFSPSSIDLEIEELEKFIKELQKITPKITYIAGNHEDRTRKWIWKNEVIHRLGQDRGIQVSKLSFATLYGLDELGVKYLEYGDGVWLGKLFCTHGRVVRKHSAFSAKAEWEGNGCSTLTGHTHRIGRYSVTLRGGTYASFENACLCSLNPEYIKGVPNWQHGFSIVHVSPNGLFNVNQIDILKRSSLFYGGKEYS